MDSSLQAALRAARPQIAEIGRAFETATARVELLKRRREELRAAPATAEDVGRATDRWVEGKLATWRESLHGTLQAISSVPDLDRALTPAGNFPYFTRLFGSNIAGDRNAELPADGALIALVGEDRAKAVLRAEAVSAVRDGVSREARAKELAKLDAEIAELEKEIDLAVAAAGAAGILLGD